MACLTAQGTIPVTPQKKGGKKEGCLIRMALCEEKANNSFETRDLCFLTHSTKFKRLCAFHTQLEFLSDNFGLLILNPEMGGP